jgi:hypothetical protein
MRIRNRFSAVVAGLVLLAGCFSPQLLEAPYQEPIESQREYADEFNNPVALGNRWRPVSGWWDIREGQLLQKLSWRSSLPGDFQMVYVYGLASGPYVVESHLNFMKEGDQSAGLLLRFQDQNNYYLLRLRHYPKWQDYVDLTQYVSGVRREDLCRMNLSVKPGQWYGLKAEDRGDEIVCFLDGNEVFRYRTEDRPTGTVGLAVKTGHVSFDRFSATRYERGGVTSGMTEVPPAVMAEESPVLLSEESPVQPLTSRTPHSANGSLPDDPVFDPSLSAW